MLKYWLIRLGIVGGTFLASIPLAEIAFRLAGVYPSFGTEGVYEAFEHGVYRLRPDTTTVQPTYPKNFTMRTNSLGMRGHEDQFWEPTDGPLDILLVGDSMTVGDRVDYDECFAGVFTRVAARAGLTVANMAVQAHSLQNQAGLLRWLHGEQGVRPRILVIGMGPEAVARTHGPNRPHVYRGGLWTRKPNWLMLSKFWVARHSSAYLLLRNSKVRLFHGEVAEHYLDDYRHEMLADRAPRLFEVMRQIRSIVGDGTHIVLVFLPASNFVDIQRLARETDRDDISVSYLLDVLRKAARAGGAEFLDMRPKLERLVAAGVALGLPQDPHYSVEANSAIGDALWESLDWRALARNPRR